VVASSFADPHRRVLLVGEAAHLFPPFGARGMNSGIADAESAANAVAAALAVPGLASVAVDEFAERRRAAATFNSQAAGAALAPQRGADRFRRPAWLPDRGGLLAGAGRPGTRDRPAPAPLLHRVPGRGRHAGAPPPAVLAGRARPAATGRMVVSPGRAVRR